MEWREIFAFEQVSAVLSLDRLIARERNFTMHPDFWKTLRQSWRNPYFSGGRAKKTTKSIENQQNTLNLLLNPM